MSAVHSCVFMAGANAGFIDLSKELFMISLALSVLVVTCIEKVRSLPDGYNVCSLHLMIDTTLPNVLVGTIKQVVNGLGHSGRTHVVTTCQELHLTVGYSFCHPIN